MHQYISKLDDVSVEDIDINTLIISEKHSVIIVLPEEPIDLRRNVEIVLIVMRYPKVVIKKIVGEIIFDEADVGIDDRLGTIPCLKETGHCFDTIYYLLLGATAGILDVDDGRQIASLKID